MIFKTRKAARASLREFDVATQARFTVVKFWSTQDGAHRYTRTFA